MYNKYILILALTVLSGACTQDFLDVNNDPNRAVESNITAKLVLPQAMLNTANRVGTSYGFLAHWMGYWCPSANYAPNAEEQTYSITTNFGAGLFSGIMDNTYDYQFAENSAVRDGQDFFIGVAKVMKAHNFVCLVDLYNNVPYTEAMKGLEFVRPKYDDGKLVYEESLKEIDAAIALFKKATAAGGVDAVQGASDIMFGGNEKMWLKFANTLKLRMLIHQSGRADRASYISAEIAKIVAEGSGFLGSGEDASVAPAYTADKPNAFYGSYGFNVAGNQATDFVRANKTSIDFLKLNGDPRIAYFYKPAVSALPANASEPFKTEAPAQFRGNEYGRPIDNSTYPYQIANYVSQVGGVSSAGAQTAASTGLVKGYNQRMWILTSVESMFLQAEAIQRGWLAGDKEAAYKDAVRESFRWLNVDKSRSAADAAFTAWYTAQDENNNGNVSYADATDKLKLVLFQKYIAMNGSNHLEAWTDYRRNGAFPALPLSINPGRTSSVLPVRLLYPQREYDLNTESVQAVGTVNQFTSKIWWMN
jgi:hypothetical protein